MNSMSSAPRYLQRLLLKAIGLLNFNHILVLNRPSLPGDCGVLYLGLHRNGVMDALPYIEAAPNAAYLVSAQLHRTALGRFMFPGIAVSRDKDRSRGIEADNRQSIARCVDLLASGGELFVMPEGTSSLGPHRLPLKPGAARIAQAVLARGRPLTVVPVAVHYECAWAWQSRVEVVFGTPLHLTPELGTTAKAIQRRFSAALDDVGINVDSIDELRLIEMLAYGATLGTGLRYSHCLKRFERNVPPKLRHDAATLDTATGRTPVLKHQGIPLTLTGTTLPYIAAWALLAPIMLAAVLVNLPPLVAAHLGARRLADELNVVAFFRMLVGVPVAMIWTVLAIAVFWLYWGPFAALAYVSLSGLALRLWYPFRTLSVALFNRMFAPRIKRPLAAFRDTLTRSVRNV